MHIDFVMCKNQYQTSILLQNIKKIEGGPIGNIKEVSKSHKTEKGESQCQ